jgi:hypothetical protein
VEVDWKAGKQKKEKEGEGGEGREEFALGGRGMVHFSVRRTKK